MQAVTSSKSVSRFALSSLRDTASRRCRMCPSRCVSFTEDARVQAGIAMGLAKSVATRFPAWGPDFATLMVPTICPPPKSRGSLLRLLFMINVIHTPPATCSLGLPGCASVARLHTASYNPPAEATHRILSGGCFRATAAAPMVILSPQIGVVLINMLAGPSLFRGAIVAVGEAKRRRPHQESDQSPGPKCAPPRDDNLRRRPGLRFELRKR